MMSPQRILVIGASGYIGQHLIPKLIAEGHQVTATARRQEWLRNQPWPNVSCHYLDMLQPDALPSLLTEIDVVYYLMHGMGENERLIEREACAAEYLRHAVAHSSVKQIIYLGALQPQHSDSLHLQARKITGEILRQSTIPVTELRASIIVGPGSAAIEIMRDMVYNLPLLTPPRWVRSKTAPIALDNLLIYLVYLLNFDPHEHRIFDVAGPEFISYQTMFERFIALSGKRRLLLPLPLPLNFISRYFISLITSVPSSLAQALILGLRHDIPANDTPIKTLIPQTLIGFDRAIQLTLEQDQRITQQTIWGYDPSAQARWKPNYAFYPKQAGSRIKTSASAANLWKIIQQIGGKEGYFYANWLWKIRTKMDDMLGNHVIYQRPDSDTLKVGDIIDSWKVICLQPEQQLTLLFGMKAPGLGRLSFTIIDHGDYREVDVRAWWHPAGFSGLLYWFAMIPAHLFIFRGMAKRIATLAQAR